MENILLSLELAREIELAEAMAAVGCAEGMQAARDMASETARLLGCKPAEVLVASTGVIGVALNIEAIRKGLPAAIAELGPDQGPQAAGCFQASSACAENLSTRTKRGILPAAAG